MTSLRLMLRRHRWMIGAWTVLLITLSGATVSAYQSTYPTAQQRLLAVRLAQDDPSGLLVYGSLPTPGTPPLMFTWEIGAFATVLVSIMAVLLVISLTRAAEDDGTAELMRTAGMGSRVPLQTAVAVVLWWLWCSRSAPPRPSDWLPATSTASPGQDRWPSVVSSV